MATWDLVTREYVDPWDGVNTTGMRFVGKVSTEGGPTAGDWLANDIVQDVYGALWRCTASGTPGTWVNMSPGFQDQVPIENRAEVSWISNGGSPVALSSTPTSLPVADATNFSDPSGSNWEIVIGNGVYEGEPENRVLATYSGISGNNLTGVVTQSGDAESAADGLNVWFAKSGLTSGYLRIPNGITTGSGTDGRAHDLTLCAPYDDERTLGTGRADYDIVLTREAGSFGQLKIDIPIRFNVDTIVTDGSGSTIMTFAGSQESPHNAARNATMLPTGTVEFQARIIGGLGSSDALVFQNRSTASAKIQFENSSGTRLAYTDETGVQIDNQVLLRFGTLSGSQPTVSCDSSSRISWRIGSGGIRWVNNAFTTPLLTITDAGLATFSGQIKVSNTAATINSGTGSPEGALVAPPGSIYLRTDGSTGTSIYVKEAGVSVSTGWVAK